MFSRPALKIVVSARLDVEEPAIEGFPGIVVLTDEDAVTLVTGDRLLSRKLIFL